MAHGSYSPSWLHFWFLLNVRLHQFNRELDGFRAVAALVPPGSDLQTLVPETESTDPVFGPAEFGQIPAWLTAQQGGLIANDSAGMPYYQLPIRRNDVPSLQHYAYTISHGGYERYRGTLRRLTMTARASAARQGVGRLGVDETPRYRDA